MIIEFGRVWKEVVMAHFMVQSWHLSRSGGQKIRNWPSAQKFTCFSQEDPVHIFPCSVPYLWQNQNLIYMRQSRPRPWFWLVLVIAPVHQTSSSLSFCHWEQNESLPIGCSHHICEFQKIIVFWHMMTFSLLDIYHPWTFVLAYN
jgi:hypothetical protein